MLKKKNHIALLLLPACGSLVVQIDAHPVGASILAITVVLVAAIDAWSASRKKR